MKKYYLIISLFLCCLFINSALAQDLNALVTKLQQAVTPVQTGSKNYEATLESPQPGTIKYAYDEIDQKGNRTNFVYEFNLADIDPYAVRENTQKDVISSVLAVKNKQKLVKVYKNKEVQSYDDLVVIYASNIESARNISDLVKKAIPPAEKVAASRLKVSGYDGMITWLGNNVKDVTLGTKSIGQFISKFDEPGTLLLRQRETDSKGAVETEYTFNLADINVNSVMFKVAGNKFAITMQTLQKAKYIGVMRAGERRPYVDDITINTNNVDEARDLKTVFTLLIPLAVEKVKASMPAATTEKEALTKLKTYAGNVSLGPRQYEQTMDQQCACTFTQIEKDAKTTTSHVYQFNWMDLNPVSSVIDVSGEKVFLDLQMNNKDKLIKHEKNDKHDGYDSEFKIYFSSIENARRAKVLADKAIEKCASSYKDPFPADAKSVVTWLRNNIKDVTNDDVTLKQGLELVEDGNVNKLKYTRTELNSKGSGAVEVYEFNLSDLNPLSVQTDVKLKWLYISVEADFKSKIIKYYKDGKIQPYAAKIDFAVSDTEQARAVSNALKKGIKGVKPAK
ncbi:MAG TPA: hypothetical protein VD816_00425 [Ohtaekwangia sp.]|nr:hypothetical protein [Ohtaekwangia sp.]